MELAETTRNAAELVKAEALAKRWIWCPPGRWGYNVESDMVKRSGKGAWYSMRNAKHQGALYRQNSENDQVDPDDQSPNLEIFRWIQAIRSQC